MKINQIIISIYLAVLFICCTNKEYLSTEKRNEINARIFEIRCMRAARF